MNLENAVIYQIFTRNYSQEGTFNKIVEDLPRLKDLGVDIIYLTPIHPIGILQRKGTWGSPYAIRDYFAVSEDLGSLNDFIFLVNKTHEYGLKIILDMVFNHTSPDNVLIDSHPEYYFYKNGKRGNRIGDWSDIIDLDNTKEETREYLLSVIKYWLEQGVDGFRFDVASLIPIELFKEIRKRFGEDIILFAECIDPNFANYVKSINVPYYSDEELGQYFDILYNYNYLRDLINYFHGEEPLEEVIDKINNDVPVLRAHCLENHDVDRIASYFDDIESVKYWVKFAFNLKGPAFLYMGQEYGIKHKPNLFEKDPVIWPEKNEMYDFYKELIKEKHKR